ncbi:MAG TPA: radical SAM protein [Gammaproteobacteria bacterium]|jgi:sulfatase maturation enzyme AslB (radical SAM superfamily)
MSVAAGRIDLTPDGEPRGYIQTHALRELWFHTGTACNLACPFCLEGSKPGDGRLERITLEDIEPLIQEAISLDVEQFSFTGGEPFIVKDFVNILRYASARKPCLVLTNGTDPVLRRLHQIKTLRTQPYPVAFRISVDYPDQARHDAGRGAGSFEKSWMSLRALLDLGFKVSIARQMSKHETRVDVDEKYRALLETHGLPVSTTIVPFPDFLTPGARPTVPYITENCMTTYQTEESRRAFMCAFSRMVVKKAGRMRVYACTLVDDDESYDLGSTLAESLGKRVMMRHHRCYSCFAFGSSCSEIDKRRDATDDRNG